MSALMRVDWKSVGPVYRRVPLGHRGVLEARREDRPPPLRHPAHHPVRTIQRSSGGRQQQDQDHHQDRLRLQEPRQPHRPGHAQMRRPQPPTPRTPITRKPDQGPTPTQTPEEPFFRMHSVMPAVLFRRPGKTPILTLSNNAHRYADRTWLLLSTSLGISKMRRLCLRFKAEAQMTQSIFHGFFSTGPLIFRIITSRSVKIYRT